MKVAARIDGVIEAKGMDLPGLRMQLVRFGVVAAFEVEVAPA
jgi:hypothetical protein